MQNIIVKNTTESHSLNGYFHVKQISPRFLKNVKWRRNKSFLYKEKLKDFVTSRPDLQERLKYILQIGVIGRKPKFKIHVKKSKY